MGCDDSFKISAFYGRYIEYQRIYAVNVHNILIQLESYEPIVYF
ncbi:hypothetical protein GV51_0065 [Gardnerella vaginalis 5-1]|nr:hypothetical protein GV51_0065 [Gardnerella vaginalis 5-1]